MIVANIQQIAELAKVLSVFLLLLTRFFVQLLGKTESGVQLENDGNGKTELPLPTLQGQQTKTAHEHQQRTDHQKESTDDFLAAQANNCSVFAFITAQNLRAAIR